MRIWLHRISWHAEIAYPLLDNNCLSIGYSDFSEQKFIDGTIKDGWEYFEKSIHDVWDENPKTRYNLWRFVYEMKKGDLVVVPSSGTFSVFELLEDLPKTIGSIELSDLKDWHGNKIEKNAEGLLIYSDKTVSDEVIELGFFRNVKLIKRDIPRYEYADSALTSKMKIRSTNAEITGLKDNLFKAISAFEKGTPINIYSIIIDNTGKSILNTLRKELNDTKFEKLILWYFQRIGSSEAYIPAKNESGKEGDADVVAVFEPIKTIIYTQVKFHSEGTETDSWAIDQINGYKDQKDRMDDGYSKIGWVISSADGFSNEAIDLAKETKVQLIDGIQLAIMLLEAGITNLNKGL